MCTEDLALHQPAWQSSTWFSDTGAERAVDGLYLDLWRNRGQCAWSVWEQTVEWGVDLGGVKSIHHVFLHHATGMSMLGISFKITDCYLK